MGGIRLGFEDHDWQCVFSSEWDKYAQQTYAANFGVTPEGDITKIDPTSIPEFDALVAGWPCQSFSRAGLYWNGTKGFADPTRGTLFFNIATIVACHRPQVVFLENVRNLAAHDDGKTIRIVEKTLKDLGYKVKYQIFNAKHFGVPQSRSRIYIVAIKSDDVDSIYPDEEFYFPKPPMISTRVGDILEPSVADKYTLSDKMWKWHQDSKANNEANNKGFGYSLFTEDSPYTSTITRRYYKDGKEILIQQNGKNPRMITPREAARLQGFPDDFKIPVSDNQAYKQFGNSVAVPVIKAIAGRIKEYVQGRR